MVPNNSIGFSLRGVGTLTAPGPGYESDRELMEGCLAREPRAMRAFYERNENRMYALALRLTRNVADAEDAVQDAFVRAFRFLPSFRGDSALSTWLYRITVNVCRDSFKRSARYLPEEKGESRRGVAQPVNVVDGIGLERALSALSEGYREVLVMHDVLGMRHEEIADVLEIQPGTSKSQLHKARAKMKDLLAGA